MDCLLDTCTLIWAVSEPGSLSPTARETLEEHDTQVYVSPISCAELACLVDRGRVELDRHWKIWFNHFVALNEWRPLAIDVPVVQEAYSLPGSFHPDPADRLLVATARLHGCTLVTADNKILSYPHVETLW